MNPSLSILQKLKDQLKSVLSKTDYHIAFAPFSFTLTNEDFFFLRTDITTGSDTNKYYNEQAEFARIANSVLKAPNIWALSGDDLLYDIFKVILDDATSATISPDFLTADEQSKVNDATAKLYKTDGSDSKKYLAYKKYKDDYSKLEGDAEKSQLLAEWYTKGYKNYIESALTTITNIYSNKTKFIEKWAETRDVILPANLRTLSDQEEFYATSCIPNGICNYQAPIWKKITLLKQEILTLSESFTKELPNDVITAFGNIEMQLESIVFEYCILDIIRPWFDDSLLKNSYWKYIDETRILSEGNDNMIGEIPAYPIKLILAKNIDLVFTPNDPQNEEIKNKLINGDRIFFGPLLLKTIPLNLASEKIDTFRIQQLSTSQLSVLTTVAIQKTTVSPTINKLSKFKVLELMNRQPLSVMKKNVEIKSFNPNLIKASSDSLAPVKSTVISPGPLKPQLSIKPMIFKPNFATASTTTQTPSQPTLPPISVISGKIVDETNQPVEIAEIQLMKTVNAITQSVLSSADGTYNFVNIENEIYQITVRKTGHTTIEKTIEIGGNMNQDFILPHQPTPSESFQLMGVVCKKMPKLPNPINGAEYL